MNRAILVSAALSVVGAGAGWVATPPVPPAPRSDLATRAPSLDLLREEYRRTGALLERLSFVEASEAAAVSAPPPPPDVAHLFRRDLTAIETRTDGAIVWIVDFSQRHGRRGLRVGDVYQDGWRVAAIAPQTILLRRRRESRRIDVFAPTLEPNQ